MGQAELSLLAEKLLDDPELRAEFTRDPDAAAERLGISLDDSDHQALDNLGVKNMEDEELVARISKRSAADARC